MDNSQTIDKTIINNDIPSEPRKKPRKASREIIAAIDAENEKLLTECEAVYNRSMSNFAEVGKAIKTIRDKKLYKKTHNSFSKYCEERLGLKRRTAYQKIEVAEVYETVRNCAQFPPVNEYQVRQLCRLKTTELQQEAWRNVVASVGENQIAPTADDVKKAVKLIKLKDSITNWTDRFILDRVYHGITFRWEIEYSSYKNTKTNVVSKIALKNLPLIDSSIKEVVTNSQVEGSVVIVSPDRNLIRPILEKEHFIQLIEACKSAPNYHFIIWTSHPEVCQNIKDWPQNISLVLRINTLADVKKLDLEIMKDMPFDTLWLTPTESISLVVIPDKIKRVLIGKPGWLDGKTDDVILSLRRIIGQLLFASNRISVDIAADAQSILYK
jgi:hypothetical protein